MNKKGLSNFNNHNNNNNNTMEEDHTNYGGYDNQQDMGGGDQQQQQQQQGGNSPKKLKANHSLIPVTIRQILEAMVGPDDIWRIGEREINQICFVGCLRSLSPHSTFINYMVEDGTGGIDMKEWFNAEDAEAIEQKQSRSIGSYVKIVGVITSFNQKKHVLAYNVHPIQDFNEISHHFLKAIVANLYHTRGPLGLNNLNAQQPQQQKSGGQQQPQPQPQQQPLKQKSAQQQQQLMSELQEKIQQLLSENVTQEGKSIQEISKALNGVATFDQVKQILQYMADEMILYQPMTDYFALTET